MAWCYRAHLILAYISFLAAVGFSLLVPHLFGTSIDRLVRFDPADGRAILLHVETAALALMAFALIGASLMRGLSNFARAYTTDSLSQKVAFDLRNQLYDKLQHLSFAFHDTEHTGNLMSKATADVESIRRFVNQGIVRSLDVLVRLIAITGILVFLNWKLALLSLICIPFIVLRSTLALRKLRAMWLHVQELMGESSTLMQENLVGIHVVKAFAAEAHEEAKYDAKIQELRHGFFQSERLQASNTAWMTLYSTLTLGLIVWFGGLEVMRGNLTAGGLTQFVLYLSQLAFPIRAASRVINSFSRALSAGERLFGVLDTRSPVEERPAAKTMDRVQGQVCFDRVSFSYDPQTPALKQVEVEVAPGQMIAILGAPGSGKSSIVNLLPRFYDVTEGRITIDGGDIRDFTLNSLRRNVGMVQQDVFLFSASIRDNIAYGVAHAAFEDVVQAAKIAQLHDQIMRFPDGYETEVGERGVTLSGGQKQRLAIARTILIDPPILILDDATSSVDVETERLIHRAMIAVMQGRTTFVIAHRLSTVRQADLILVLQDGEIVERGAHRELLAQGGLYQDIYELQFRPQEDTLLAASIAQTDGVKR
ncbi:ABC transporter transmembrane domain-containing protein [Candidatus Entotheonella palauensis]|nr:ABC transporter ATP-binding protein [Candidatus Entotheonella palauensis]